MTENQKALDDFNPNREAVWVAHYWDFSDIAVFAGGLECLRYALSNSMSVARVPLGMSVREALSRPDPADTRNEERTQD